MFNQKGFSLVEVLVASLVIVIGVTGYVTLQSQYVVANSNLSLRSIAVRLAADKLSDLQFFEQLDGSSFSYAIIGDNTGGSIPFGDRDIILSANNVAQTHSFTISWLVSEYFYIDSDFDGLCDLWVKSGDLGYPDPEPQYSDMKSINVTIEWTDLGGSQKIFLLSGVVIPIAMGNSFQALYRASSSTSVP
ncbi:prepilin-type N-terminal cleavage/methylation domain-containing protein [uncultured Paraglaciecola sp.]|uniref:type IV pilus modification PilV family protein n=1 Tax=uncultured Paraglaciecola sp. TaxID=1765024 RepID=UPI0025993241|nr:prepilin-type N-terminal cleavage/methylation domain-containing protein [uncultured Paraglaciecola sp.]